MHAFVEKRSSGNQEHFSVTHPNLNVWCSLHLAFDRPTRS